MTELEQYDQDLTELIEDVAPLLTEIQRETKKARKAMDTDPVDTLTLSNKLVDLSILNQRLGDRVANAGHLARATQNFYELMRETHKVRLVKGYDENGEAQDTVAAGVADSMKLQFVQAEFEVANNAKRILDQLSMLRKSTEKTIDGLRTKISYEKVNERNA